MAASNDQHYTYNELTNEDKDLLLRNGYIPGELDPDEARDLLRDLRAQDDDDNFEAPADERDS